ncbi:MAG: chemotaxis protein CheX [Treponema sp.]|nr:chemotaxis protein CheX [Treponema sp.]
MDVKVINPFLNATLQTFKQMFQVESKNNEPFVVDVISGHQWEVSGLLGVTGDYSGVVAVRLHKTLAFKLLELSGLTDILPDEKLELSQELVSEVTNIISGSAVSALSSYNLTVSPPVTITGKDHVISWPKNYPVVGIPFITPYGPYEVDVCFK